MSLRLLSPTVAGPRVLTQAAQQGLPGPPGVGSDSRYTHVQGAPASVWVVTHGLGKYPSVVVIDSSNEVVSGDVRFPTLNTAVLTFSGAFSGVAAFN
jgi:hypothetical protein